MAGDWIPMSTDLWTCPEVVRILSGVCPVTVRSLSESVREKSKIIGALYRTWSLFDAHTDDGILHGYTAETLDAEVGIDGWAMNLQHVGWLIVDAQSLRMPGFDVWLSSSAKARLKERQRKRNERSQASGNCPESVRKLADKKRTTEEERRVSERTNERRAALEAADKQLQETWPELFREPYTATVVQDHSQRITNPCNALTEKTLETPADVARWFAGQLASKNPALPSSVRWLVVALAWAEVAKRGRKPVAVFVSLVKKLRVSEAADHVRQAVLTVDALYRSGVVQVEQQESGVACA